MFINIGGDGHPAFGVLYNNLFNTPAADPTSYVAQCIRNRPCVPDPFHQPECATDDPATRHSAAFFKARMYPATQLKDGGADVGLLAELPVRMVAFGSIPAVATLTLRASRVDGKVKPFEAYVWDTKSNGCDPEAPQHADTVVVGQIDVALSNLTVDGVPVDIGSACRTVRSADIQLRNTSVYTPAGGGTLGAYDGLGPASLGPLPSSPLYGDLSGWQIPATTGITIPPFEGCGNGSDDLSPLVTAMASGPNNPVTVRQSPLFQHYPGVDLDQLGTICTPEPPSCPLPGPDLPERPPLPAGDE
ncbi:hypothetical protein DX116_04175 [Aeromicrobium endophyticum]|uniref:Uncharacterized protein n=2 Tax=Aeromicrobium endophyticum TaxID=2292704 RepID=A0A371PA36_9ACTN|nr:hypothetical protein DX116_04175 [Aeromicrobium endophyticum]